MSEAATAEKPDLKAVEDNLKATEKEPEQASALGGMSLFVADDYEVKTLGFTLGAINVENVKEGHPLYGLLIGDDVDLVIRDAKVTGGKPDHKGNVTLILHGKEIDVLKPKGPGE